MGIYRIAPRAGDAYLIPGDLHYPIHDPAAVAAMQRYFDALPARRKTVVLHGDTIDSHSVSRHTRKADRLAAFPRLVDEAETARPFLQWAGGHGCVAVPGNHEDWLSDIVDNNPGLAGSRAMEFHRVAGLDDIEGVRWLPYGTWVVVGRKLVILHGDGLPRAPHLMARKFPDQVTVYGHTHALASHFTTVYDPEGGAGVRGAVNVGHMSLTHRHEYVRHPDWQQGFGIAEFFGPRPWFRVTLHQILRDERGRCHVA